LRKEIIGNDEFKQRGGFDTTTQQHLIKHVQVCDKWRRVITYHTEDEPLSEIMRKAIDTKNLTGTHKVEGQNAAGEGAPLVMGIKPFTGDEVQGAPGMMRQLPWALDGTNIDIPLNSALNFRNNNGLLLHHITPHDSMRMYQRYVEILEYLKIFGGDGNRVDHAVGVLPSEEPRGPGVSPNLASENAGKSNIQNPRSVTASS
jgi:hypothetical protein